MVEFALAVSIIGLFFIGVYLYTEHKREVKILRVSGDEKVAEALRGMGWIVENPLEPNFIVLCNDPSYGEVPVLLRHTWNKVSNQDVNIAASKRRNMKASMAYITVGLSVEEDVHAFARQNKVRLISLGNLLKIEPVQAS